MGERDYIVTIYRSAGNESVGDMWTETKVFEYDKTLKDVMDWVDNQTHESAHRAKVVITVSL